MLLDYLRIALRNIRRNKLYSVISIGCLAIGIAVAMTISLYILHEHSYDGWHANSRRIFSVSTTESFGAMSWPDYTLSYLTGPMVRQTDGAVESMVRTRMAFEGVDLANPAMPETHFRENDRFFYVDSNFFQFFSFRLIRGTAAGVLARPFTVVLSETAAKKYFGAADPVGRTLLLDRKYRLEVTGVAADAPSNSSLVFDFAASLSTMEGMDKYEGCLKDQQVHPGTFATWLLLKNAGDTTQVMRNLSRLSLRAEEKDVESAEKAGGTEYSHRYFLTPLADTHLHGAGSFSGNHRYLNIFALVAALILLLALLNYMSLATARAMVRAKEVGVRKVMGARRSRIAAQFYTESALYAVLSFLAAIVVFLWLRIWFFGMIHQKIDFDFLMTPRVLVCFAALLGLVIFISGSYPALVMSAFRPVTVLYGKLSRQRSGERIRKGFIVLQFTISMALVICCVVIGKQLHFLRHTDTGVDRENVLMLPFGSSMKHYGPYKQAVAALPAVIGVATTHYKLYAGGVMITLVQVPGKTAPVTLYHLIADSNFVPLMGLKWKEKPIPGNSWFDRNHLVLNETAVQDFDLRGRATGRPIHVDGRPVTVMGVLRDFNFWSLHQHIEPLSITVTGDAEKEWGPGIGGCLYVKLGSHANIPTVIEGIRKIYSRFDDLTPFEFQFLDEAFDSEYKLEDQLAELLKTFTLITIVIACLGLFALATFAAQQRVKEIGIRKVLGASVGSIGALLSLDFLRPVLLAALIASPLSWWLMNKWLQDFAYRTSLSWWIFLAAGIGLLLVALVTVLFRTIRAAQANPTINLRSE